MIDKLKSKTSKIKIMSFKYESSQPSSFNFDLF